MTSTWAFDTMVSLKRRIPEDVNAFMLVLSVRESLFRLEQQAAKAERDAIRQWNERRFFRALRKLAKELETA